MRLCSVDGCEGTHRARGLCSKHWKQEYGTATRYAITCEWCGAEHMSARKTGYACSTEHRGWLDTYRSGKPASCGLSTDHPARKLQYLRERWPVCKVSFKACVVCGKAYRVQGRALTCPGVCRDTLDRDIRRDAEHRRRARERAAFVAPVRRSEIYKRDGYMCRLCGDPMMMGQAVPHPKAPTIDHVIPLAKGGTHEPANVQAAHFLCNSIKGDRH